MDTAVIIQIIALVLLLCLSAFASGAETALTTVNRIRLRTLAENGNKRASSVLQITEDTSKLLSAILITNNIANIASSSLVTTLTIRLFGNRWVGLAAGVLTLLVLIFAEISPKTAAAAHAESFSMAVVPVIRFLMTILTPVIFLINLLSKGFLWLIRVKPDPDNDAVTEEELRTLLDVSRESGVIEEDEHEMMHNIFDLGDTQVRDIMVPRIHVTMLDVNSTYPEVMEIYREDLHTRFPVYDDNPDHIIGIIIIKDLLLCRDREHWQVRDDLRSPYFTFENKYTQELLMEMRRDSVNMALVLDEYGTFSGIVTMEDILEEIVGEIHDEYDEDEETPLKKTGDKEYLAEGSMNLEDFCEETGLSLESEDYDSLAGFMIQQLERIPVVGDSVTTPEGAELIVDSMDDKRIARIRIRVL